jgi:hypothetical protein
LTNFLNCDIIPIESEVINMKIIDKTDSTVPFSALGIGSVCKIPYEEGSKPSYVMKIPRCNLGSECANAVDLEDGDVFEVDAFTQVIPIEVELVVV